MPYKDFVLIAGSDEWEYYIQRFETELDLHNLLAGDHAADACQNLLLSKIGPDAFKVRSETQERK